MKVFRFCTVLIPILFWFKISFGNQTELILTPTQASSFVHSLQISQQGASFKAYVVCSYGPYLSRTCSRLVINPEMNSFLESSESILAEYCKLTSNFKRQNSEASEKTAKYFLDFAIQLKIPKLQLDGLLLTCEKSEGCKDAFCDPHCKINHMINQVSCP